MGNVMDHPSKPAYDHQLVAAIKRKAHESSAASLAFFDDQAEAVSALAAAMSERFAGGGRLFVMGNGGSSCDAEHVSVEFMHPIFEKRKPLPCISLTTGNALLTAISNDVDFSRVFSTQLRSLATEKDMALAISTSGMSANLVAALKEAREIGCMTIAFGGKDGGRVKELADWSLVVPSYSIHRIQEAHTLLLHILWDSIHLCMGEEDVV